MTAAMQAVYEQLKIDHPSTAYLWVETARYAVAAVLPLYEQKLREQIATYLERDLVEARHTKVQVYAPDTQRIMDLGDSVLRHAAMAVRDGGGSA